jgi:hypothetical protein
MGEGLSPTWDAGPLDTVLMTVHNTINYQLNGTRADAQWAAMMPPGEGLVHLGPNKEPFMVSMFHQLRCLNIIRQAYEAGSHGNKEMDAIGFHCLNYIRQMVLCRGDRRMERVVDPYGAHAVQVRDTQTCKDWRAVYSMVENNDKEHRIS